MNNRPALQCVGCLRTPDEIPAIVSYAEDEGLSPDEWVWQEEGTLNSSNGHFTCDGCYIKFGMPSAPGGWVAP